MIYPVGSSISIQSVLRRVYPVGSIYISTVSTNPANLFGFGTWTAFGAGRTIVGLDSGQTEFDTVEETGGEKTHTLTTGEIASHTHTFRQKYALNNGTSPSLNGDQILGGSNGVYNGSADYYNAMPSGNTGSSGTGEAHNNLQPYIVVHMWKRTA